ncbi:MAG: hypothetical protein M3387_14920 [Actinomycetota bacterium]|nr:hypothetical protein [Actinomycetota bacterium]
MATSSLPLGGLPLLLESFVTGYWSRRTRANYALILGGWFAWCANNEHDRDPIEAIRRPGCPAESTTPA